MNEELYFVRAWPVPLRGNICLLDVNQPTTKEGMATKLDSIYSQWNTTMAYLIKKNRHPIVCAWRVSGITFIRHAHSQKTGKANNSHVVGSLWKCSIQDTFYNRFYFLFSLKFFGIIHPIDIVLASRRNLRYL